MLSVSWIFEIFKIQIRTTLDIAAEDFDFNENTHHWTFEFLGYVNRSFILNED